ncbi:porin [Burkholderia multivorans]|nr:porin [Burkholderia multivorans]SAJ61113.1 porin [Burkholderia multivorans]
MSGLSSQYGTVTLGRQYDSVVDFVGPLEAGDQWGGYIAAHPGDLDNFNNAYRVNNAVKYTSPTYGGFSFAAACIASAAKRASSPKNQVWSLGAGYNNGPLVLVWAYLNARTPSNFGGIVQQRLGDFEQRLDLADLWRICKTRTPIRCDRRGWCVHVRRSDDRGQRTRTSSSRTSTSARTLAKPRRSTTAEINFKYQLTPALILGAAVRLHARQQDRRQLGSQGITKARWASTTSCRSGPTST